MLNAHSNITAVDVNFHEAAMTGSTFSSPPPPPAQQSSQPDDVKPRCDSSSSLQLQEYRGGVRGQCGATMSRTISSSRSWFRGTANGGSSMRRTFSLRSSSSLAEGYWRIHDSTGDELDLQHDGDLVLELQQQQMKSASRKKKGMILKAWKKLFGF